MYTEFLGLPGSGKTSAIREIERYPGIVTANRIARRKAHLRPWPIPWLARMRPSVATRLLGPSLQDAGIFALYNPELVAALSEAFSRLNRDNERVAQWTFRTIAEYAYMHEYARVSDELVVDEGMHQRMLSFLLRGVDPVRFNWPHVDRVILVEVPIEVAVARLASRGVQRVDLDDSTQKYIEKIAASSPASVVRIDGTSDLQTVIRNILAAIE